MNFIDDYQRVSDTNQPASDPTQGFLGWTKWLVVVVAFFLYQHRSFTIDDTESIELDRLHLDNNIKTMVKRVHLLLVLQGLSVLGMWSLLLFSHSSPSDVQTTKDGIHTIASRRRLFSNNGQDLKLAEGPSASSGSSALLDIPKNIYSPPQTLPKPPPQLPLEGIPTLVRTEFYTQGPVDAQNIQESSPLGNLDTCMTIGETLDAIGATRWKKVLTDAGLKTLLLDARDAQATVLVPLDYTFFSPIDAQPLRDEKTIDELLFYAPELKKPLAGAAVLKGLWPSDSMGTGMRIPTSNSLGMNGNQPNILHVVVGENKVLQAQNNNDNATATVLEWDIVTCGPSILHIIDTILLPFAFDNAPTDAITKQ